MHRVGVRSRPPRGFGRGFVLDLVSYNTILKSSRWSGAMIASITETLPWFVRGGRADHPTPTITGIEAIINGDGITGSGGTAGFRGESYYCCQNCCQLPSGNNFPKAKPLISRVLQI
ncbi:hypothetical protein FWH09_02920 [Candidatus Saccharibacteria bacterium]|nr:hypothetical protein [Candidatus Saccharibacteria bacterium]